MKAVKVISAKPGRVRRYITPKSTDRRIRELRTSLGLANNWENLKLQVKMAQSGMPVTN